MDRSGRVSPGRDQISPQAYRVIQSWNGAVNSDGAADRHPLLGALFVVHGGSALACCCYLASWAARAALMKASDAPR